MSVLRAIAVGFGELGRHYRLVLVMWLVVLTAALPASLLMEQAIREDVGTSRIHRDLERGLDLGWLGEFHDRNGQFAGLLRPVRLTGAMWMDSIELWFSGDWLAGNRSLAVMAIAFILIWILCQGGILGHLADREKRFGWASFLGAGGDYLFRFSRVAAIIGLAYFAVYRLGRWLFPAIQRWTQDWTSETHVLGANVLAAAGLIVILSYIHLIAEFARVATVREGRHSMVMAVLRSTGQILRHPAQSLGVLWMLGSGLLVWQLGYTLLAPAPEASGWVSIAVTVFVGQIYLIGRWALRIARYGAELELFDRWTGSSIAVSEPSSRTTSGSD